MSRPKVTLEEIHSKPLMTTNLGRFIDRLSYFDLVLFLVFFILFSSLFFYLSPLGGSLSNSCDQDGISFQDAIYFSIVTFSSLGYGDYSPTGANRLMSGICVFSGLAFFAVAIGKVSSERTQTTLVLLHRSDVQRRLEAFAKAFDELTKTLKNEKEQTRAPNAILDLVVDAIRLETSLRNYIFFNINQSSSITHGNEAAVAAVLRSNVKLLEELIALHVTANQKSDVHLCRKTYLLATLIQNLFIHLELHKEYRDPSLSYSGAILLWLKLHFLRGCSFALLKAQKNAYTLLRLVGQKQKVRHFTQACRLLRERMAPKSAIPRTWAASFKSAKAHIKELDRWRAQNILADEYLKAKKVLSGKPRSTWAQGEHKNLAKQLGVSNSKATKYIDEMVSRGELPQ